MVTVKMIIFQISKRRISFYVLNIVNVILKNFLQKKSLIV